MQVVVFVLAAFSILLSYGAFKQGAVVVLDGMVLSAGIGLLALIYSLFSRRGDAPPKTSRFPLLTAAVLAVVGFQLLPLPGSLLHALFPYRSEIARSIQQTGWYSMTLAPPQSIVSLFRLISYLLILWVARDLGWRLRDRPLLLITPVLIAATWETALGIVQFLGFGADPIVRGTYVARAHFATLLEMAIPLAVVAAIAVYQRGRRRFETTLSTAMIAGALLMLACAMFAIVILSLSRMGFMASLASLFFVAVIASGTSESRARAGGLRWLPIAITAAIAIAAFVFLPTNDLIARITSSTNEDQLGDVVRRQIWKESLLLLPLSPFFGVGLGAYQSAFVHFKHVAPMMTVAHVHNDYIQGLVEVGMLGFVPLALITALALKGALEASARRKDTARWLAIGCAGSLIALVLHSIVDFNLYIPANAITICWIAGIALGLGAATAHRRSRDRSASAAS